MEREGSYSSDNVVKIPKSNASSSSKISFTKVGSMKSIKEDSNDGEEENLQKSVSEDNLASNTKSADNLEVNTKSAENLSLKLKPYAFGKIKSDIDVLKKLSFDKRSLESSPSGSFDDGPDGLIARLKKATMNSAKEPRSFSSNLLSESKMEKQSHQGSVDKDLKKSNSSGLVPKRASMQSIHKQAIIIENSRQDPKLSSDPVSKRISMQSVVSKRSSMQSIHKQGDEPPLREPYISGLMGGDERRNSSRYIMGPDGKPQLVLAERKSYIHDRQSFMQQRSSYLQRQEKRQSAQSVKHRIEGELGSKDRLAAEARFALVAEGSFLNKIDNGSNETTEVPENLIDGAKQVSVVMEESKVTNAEESSSGEVKEIITNENHGGDVKIKEHTGKKEVQFVEGEVRRHARGESDVSKRSGSRNSSADEQATKKEVQFVDDEVHRHTKGESDGSRHSGVKRLSVTSTKSKMSMVSIRSKNSGRRASASSNRRLLQLKSLEQKEDTSKNISQTSSLRNSVISNEVTDVVPELPSFVEPNNRSSTISSNVKDQALSDYNEYLLLQQRHDSSNFIQRIASDEIVYETPAIRIKMLGPHLMGGKIGKGAFGKVKEGISTDTLQRIAVKIIAKNRVKKMVDTVIREIKLLQRLKHENIVKLVDVFAKVEDDEGKVGVFPWFLTIEEEPIVWMFEDGTEEERDVKILKWYIVMEFCPCSLQTILDTSPENKISIEEAHSYFNQLIMGVDYLHSQKVVHRDIKPGNILVTTDGVVKITDFGIAEQFDTYSGTPMYCVNFSGTHQFLPPEVLTDESDTGYDGTKVDIWACGVVLYNMISGCLPFEFNEDANLIDLHDKIVLGKYEMPEEAILGSEDLIEKILQVDPEKRITIAEILTHSWSLSEFTFGKISDTLLTYQHSKEAGVEEENDVLIPVETTMLPYLTQIYLPELEADIANSGLISDLVIQEEESILRENTKGKTSKMASWLKKQLSVKKPS